LIVAPLQYLLAAMIDTGDRTLVMPHPQDIKGTQ